jgi:hypothetical protein
VRTCGSCSLCCKLFGITELDKPENQWCPHCEPGKRRCTIYPDRPHSCRIFSCIWLVNERFDDRWYPHKCKIVVTMDFDREPPVMMIMVDPSRRDAWAKEPFASGIKTLARNGITGVDGKFYQTELHLFEPREVRVVT